MEAQFVSTQDKAEQVLIVGLPAHLNQLDEIAVDGQDIKSDLDELKHQQIVGTTAGQIGSTFYQFNGQPHRLITVGLSNLKDLTTQDYLKAFGNLFQYLQSERITQASLLLESFDNKYYESRSIVELIGLQSERATYRFDNYKSDKSAPYQLTLNIHTEQQDIARELEIGQIIGQGINVARDFSNMPPNILTPAYYAEQISQHFTDKSVEVDIKDGSQLQQEGFGLIHAVGKGSVNPPHLVTMTYQGGAQDQDPIALVGKGVTYDSGGYSIKSKLGMQTMKFDMCGSANVVAMISIAERLQLPINLVGVVALAENMISEQAMKPDDVFTALSGETVEVLNSDAEGRLVLGDAVFYANQFQPRYILDFATLTGAAVAALGDDKAAALRNQSTAPLEEILAIALEDGDPTFELPITQAEKDKIRRSAVADLVNHTNGHGKALFAASFISHFAGNTPHMHFDIAGPATRTTKNYNGPAGPTGFLVTTIVNWLRQQG